MVRFFIAVLLIFLSPISVIFAQSADIKTIDFSVFIEPVISLEVIPGREGRNIIFSGEEIKKDEVIRSIQISIKTNTARPYQVFIIPLGSLTNQQGKTLPPEYLKFSVTDVKKGKSEVPLPVPFPLVEKLIYTSNSQGDEETFTIMFYFWTFKKMISAGTYTLNLAYRIESQ